MRNVTTYRDFLIGVRRLDAHKVAVTVDTSPAGPLEKLATVVIKPTIRHRDLEDLIEKLEIHVVPRAEARLATVRPH
jgi:hypothetical protein